MIKNKKSLSMSESLGYIEKTENKDKDIVGFIKKFVKLKPDEATKLREKLEVLDLLKLQEEHISRIIDILPEDSDELNKVFTDVNLDEEESKKILDTVKEFK